ncbi:MAG: sigma-70 family RNA polymerase sigma factor [Deltaproteobacteria bacterium]|nr:sigma-70 family RNA polymerase sigma factor [Nannocystaceae bacterium]
MRAGDGGVARRVGASLSPSPITVGDKIPIGRNRSRRGPTSAILRQSRAVGDEELLAAWRDGDAAAGEELFGRYFPVVYGFFSNRVGDALEDLVQRTFLACASHRDRLGEVTSFRAFILVVARNQLHRYLRDRYRLARALDTARASIDELEPSMSQLIARRDEHHLLLLALRRVPIDVQDLLELHYFERLSGPELAAVLQIPEGTVRSRLRRAVILLRAEVERIAGTPELARSTIGSISSWAAEIRAMNLESGRG